MAGVGSYNKALGVEVGAVDEDLIVDSLLINASGRLDKPERFKALKRPGFSSYLS